MKLIRTEEQIDKRIERTMDVLDKQYLSGDLTEAHYQFHLTQLNRWADAQYAILRKYGRAA